MKLWMDGVFDLMPSTGSIADVQPALGLDRSAVQNRTPAPESEEKTDHDDRDYQGCGCLSE